MAEEGSIEKDAPESGPVSGELVGAELSFEVGLFNSQFSKNSS